MSSALVFSILAHNVQNNYTLVKMIAYQNTTTTCTQYAQNFQYPCVSILAPNVQKKIYICKNNYITK